MAAAVPVGWEVVDVVVVVDVVDVVVVVVVVEVEKAGVPVEQGMDPPQASPCSGVSSQVQDDWRRVRL